LHKLPANRERDERELKLLAVLGRVQLEAEGYGKSEQLDTFERIRALCECLGSTSDTDSARFTLWWFYVLSADYRHSREIIEQMKSTLPEHSERASELRVQLLISDLNTSIFTADLLRAQDEAQALARAFTSSVRPAHLSAFQWIHFGSQGYDFSSWILLLLGYPDRAAKEREQAVQLAREQGNPFSQASVLTHSLCEYPWRRTPESNGGFLAGNLAWVNDRKWPHPAFRSTGRLHTDRASSHKTLEFCQ
jgi:hypothetical protein